MTLDFVEKNGDLVNLECKIPYNKWMELVKQLKKRLDTSLRSRWEHHLKPWILQHRAGSLNLDITRMLANYLADHFQDIDSIDWPSVAANKEFSGHTEGSLRNVFKSGLLSHTRKNIKAEGSVLTLKDVAEVANSIRRRNNRVKEERQLEVIQYYEKWMER